MSLLRLPPETLAQIFDYIGSSFFREDLGRLTCFKCTTLSRETLRSLVTSGAMKRPSLKHSLETLDIELRGYHHSCSSTFDPQQNAQESNVSNAAASNEAFNDIPVKAWINVLNDDLAQLAIIAQQSRRLRTLRIRAWSSPSPDPLDNPEDYLSLPTIQHFLSMENLSVLVLDLSVSFLNSSGEQGKGLHICPDVLKPRDPDDSLRLSVVVINLSLITNQPGQRLLQLKADIREKTQALIARMASPENMRVLAHSLPQFETQSLGVLTGKTMVLGDDMTWDEDGKTVMEDSEPESELLDDDLEQQELGFRNRNRI
ncbi:hypothetical protein F5B21DRAFT_517792 [Xylaria acuta]|nr:hypothetical protein F5B21DRAFT_517792 [Xylaria acuta]